MVDFAQILKSELNGVPTSGIYAPKVNKKLPKKAPNPGAAAFSKAQQGTVAGYPYQPEENNGAAQGFPFTPASF